MNIDITPSGISIQAMDNSHVALVSLILSVEGFESYSCKKPNTIGLNLSNLYKVMKLGDNDDSMTLKAEEDPSVLTVMFENPKRGRSAEFNVSLINIDNENLNISENENGSTLVMSSSEFSKIVRELYQISESLNIETCSEFIKFFVDGDCGSGCLKLVPTDSMDREDTITLTTQDPVSQDFTLRYITMFTKASSLSNQVELQLSNESPMMLKYNISSLGYIEFYLAPKISEDS